jgi:tetratricopeptide (TPR) repeat protein
MTGQSFAGALHGAEEPSRQSYGESEFPYYNFGWSPLRCLIEERWKYIRAPQAELYDRQQDPGELENLATSQPAEVARLERELADWEQRMPRRTAAKLEVDPENLAALQALGYVGAPPPTSAPSLAGLKNPRDLVDIANNIRIAESRLAAGNMSGAFAALALLEPAVARSPESFVLLRDLGRAYAGAGLHDFAQPALEAALALQPDSAEVWRFLARVLKARGALAAAIQAGERAVQLEPGDAEMKKYLGEFRELLGKQQRRLAELRAQYQQEPGSVDVAYELGELLIESGQAEEGMGVLRVALARNHNHAVLANALAWRLATNARPALRDGAEAVRLARLACASEELSASPDALDTLSAALAEAGQFEEAVAIARRAAAQAREQNDGWLAAVLQRRISQYSAGRPFHVPEALPGK